MINLDNLLKKELLPFSLLIDIKLRVEPQYIFNFSFEIVVVPNSLATTSTGSDITGWYS